MPRGRGVIPRDPWPCLRSTRATGRAIVALYGLLFLYLALEIGRSIARADQVIFTDGYVAVGEAVLHGADPYGLVANTWPPFFLFLATAIALVARLSVGGALLLWQVLSVLAIWGSLLLLLRFFEEGGEEATFFPSSSSAFAFGSAAVAVPALMSARLIQENLQHTQINPHLLFLTLLAFHLFRENKPWRGGLALALAASLKVVPVVLLAYFAYKRRMREVVCTIVSLALLSLVLPGLVFGPDRVGDLWRSWSENSARLVSASPASHYNQSLANALGRVLTVGNRTPDPSQYRIVALSLEQVNRVFLGAAALVAVGLAWACRRHPRDLRERVCAAEYAVVLGVATLLSPLAWKAPYITLLASYLFVWSALRRLPAGPGRRLRFVIWWASFACLTLSAPALVGKRLSVWLESFSVITVGAMLILGLALSLLPKVATAAQLASGVPPGSSDTLAAARHP